MQTDKQSEKNQNRHKDRQRERHLIGLLLQPKTEINRRRWQVSTRQIGFVADPERRDRLLPWIIGPLSELVGGIFPTPSFTPLSHIVLLSLPCRNPDWRPRYRNCKRGSSEALQTYRQKQRYIKEDGEEETDVMSYKLCEQPIDSKKMDQPQQSVCGVLFHCSDGRKDHHSRWTAERSNSAVNRKVFTNVKVPVHRRR